jgi:hypothetical protein
VRGKASSHAAATPRAAARARATSSITGKAAPPDGRSGRAIPSGHTASATAAVRAEVRREVGGRGPRAWAPHPLFATNGLRGGQGGHSSRAALARGMASSVTIGSRMRAVVGRRGREGRLAVGRPPGRSRRTRAVDSSDARSSMRCAGPAAASDGKPGSGAVLDRRTRAPCAHGAERQSGHDSTGPGTSLPLISRGRDRGAAEAPRGSRQQTFEAAHRPHRAGQAGTRPGQADRRHASAPPVERRRGVRLRPTASPVAPLAATPPRSRNHVGARAG